MKINHSDYTILVVDDVMTNVLLLQVLLDKEGFNVVTANEGQAAIEIIRNDAPDLILLDINMPNMDGLTLIKKLRENPTYKFTPILMLTTESDDTKKSEGKAAGATGWLVKPFNPEKLMQVISKVCP